MTRGVSEQGVSRRIKKESGADSLLCLEKQTGKTVYELFAAMFLPHHLVNHLEDGTKIPCRNAPMHGEMCQHFRYSKRVLLVAPAKFAKSTWSAFIQPLTDAVLRLVEGPILVISNTGRLAERWLSLIKEEIEFNKELIHIFGDLKGNVWRQDQIKLKTGAEIVSLGLNYQIRGTGWGKAVCDDMEDDEMVRSEDQREKFQDWFDGAFMGRMHPHTAVVVDGTFLHPLCKIKKMYENQTGQYDNWIRLKFQALDDKGESIWPERWPTEVIKRQRQEMGEKMFLAEKMNAPVFGMDQIFRPEFIKYYDSKPQNMYIVTSLDASSGRSQEIGDYTALTVWGKDLKEDNYYLLYSERGKWDTFDKVRALFNYDQVYNPTYNLIEWDAYGNELKNVIEKEAQNRQVHFPHRLVTPDKNKGRRAMAVTDLFHKGKVFFPKSGAERLIEELLMFSTTHPADYDDFVDSTSMALNFLRRVRAKPQVQVSNWAESKRRKPNKAGRLV